jgi:hypothetical protein
MWAKLHLVQGFTACLGDVKLVESTLLPVPGPIAPGIASVSSVRILEKPPCARRRDEVVAV